MPRDSDGAGFTVTEAAATENKDDKPGKGPAQRELIIEAVQDAGVIFWHDSDGFAFATVPMNGTLRRYRVRSRNFGLVVRCLYGAANPVTGRNGITRHGSVSDKAMAEAMTAFEAMALQGEMKDPAVRILRVENSIVLDLGDDAWRAVVVNGDGWQVVEKTAAPLIRPDGMRHLPVPRHDADALTKLRRLVNLPEGINGDADFRLIVMWCLSCLWPAGSYPILALDGEQGSAKSTTCRMLRRLVDPNAGELRAPARSEDDLLIAAMNGRVVGQDNVSFIEPGMADSLCRLATGGGFGKRKLYADTDEVIVSVARPILLNGIPSLLARGDLADRALAFTLPSIPDERRRPETEVWRDFDDAAPGVLALLLDGLATALRRLPDLRLPELPRMADFTRLAAAAAPAFKWTEADILSAIASNRETAVAAVIEADPVAEAVRSLCPEQGELKVTAAELLNLINGKVADETRKERGWPKDATRLSTRLTRVMPALRRAGVEVRRSKSGDRAIIIEGATKGFSASGAFTASGRAPMGAAVGAAIAPASGENPQKSATLDAADAADAAGAENATLSPRLSLDAGRTLADAAAARSGPWVGEL